MIIRSIEVRREGDYGFGPASPDRPFRAKVEVQGVHGKVELLLSPELSRRVIEIVAAEVAEAGRQTAEAMIAEVLAVPALTGEAA